MKDTLSFINPPSFLLPPYFVRPDARPYGRASAFALPARRSSRTSQASRVRV
jgi:hypothetical protein